MASRLGRRFLAQVARPSARTAGRSVAGRRLMSTKPIDYKQFDHGDDKPWMIGSLVVFGSLAAYISTGSGKETAHHKADEKDHAPKAASTKTPGKEEVDEETPDERAEVVENIEKAATEGSPETHKLSDDEGASKADGGEAITDDEDNTTSGEEVKSSMQQAFNDDSPKDAQDSEQSQAKDGKFAEGAPGQSEEAESKPDQNEKPGETHTGTLQSDEDSGPSKVTDAREHAKSGKAPKEAGEAAAKSD
ncbi:hypothetical protein CERSUDRAFT_112365 [Gelatoporia subvermispora B]|uniref:Uncharacterized protein n=1 Tax=Ceriporiopsis subvermispora (strain B) TaxID=914234 RepID=M2RMS0_CERS8|nr:hypothetical protein CERSUDRAFT_112365 [Gelatoporia subvermispora B]